MSYRRPLIGLTVFLVVAILLTGMVHATLRRGVPGATQSYSAMFTDVSGLRVGDDVRMAGVQVGRVEAVEINGTLAEVTFEVQREQKVYDNTIASVTYQNLIGQRYLGLSLMDSAASAVLPPGTRIPVERTEPSFDLSGLLNGFQPLFGLLDPDDVDNITSALIRALQGEDSAIPTLIAETASLAQSFAGPDQVLGSIIDNLSRVVGDLAKQSGQLQTTITQTRKIFDGLYEQRDTLMNQTTDIAAVVDRAARVVQGSAPALTRFTERQPGFSSHFVDNKEEFAYLGFNIPLLMKSLARIVDHGSFLNAYICDIDVSLVPGLSPVIAQILGVASPSGRPEHSPICR
ncbi:MCE family protein [Nocardia bovistercoris]|uniref:MCE family protein n=1 Tax=Nocardia bovistercoris TaxID=2785916 RepID=A0A931I7M1_9NOCA|nr:MCE family protein [Nocardia bovistercoris]MBH0776354.1 MCE family protein [Nocardia bovistercoris]